MEPNTQKAVVMGQGDREFQTELTASSEVVHDATAEAASSEVVRDFSAEGVVTNPTQIRSSKRKTKRQVETVEVVPSCKRRKLLTKKQYGLHLSATAIFLAITIPVNVFFDEDNIRTVILAVTFLANLAMASWAMSQRYYKHQVTWKVTIFKIGYNFTRLLILYVALSMRKPNWFGWWGFVIVCIIATAYKCSDELKTKFTWCCEKVVPVMYYVIDKVFKPIRKDQAPSASAPTHASV